jgi:hypothetical protein
MTLEEILVRAGHQRHLEDLQRLGFLIPDSAYAFLVNNPSIISSRTREILNIVEWGRNEEDVAALRWRLIKVLLESGALSPNFRNMEQLQRGRANVTKLGAKGNKGAAKEKVGIAPIDAFRIVAETNRRYNRNQHIPRDLPINGEEPILIDFSKTHWPIENQGDTLACTAYAVSACVELYRAHQGPIIKDPDSLSARFVYRKTRSDIFEAGPPLSPEFLEGALMLREVQGGLENHGICDEALLLDDFSNADKASDFQLFRNAARPISPAAEKDAMKRRHPMDRLDHVDLTARPPGLGWQVYDWLRNGNPVAVTIPGWFPDPNNPEVSLWHSQMLKDYAVLPIPAPGTIVGSLGHAVCVVGYTWNVQLEQGFHEIYPGYFFKDHPGYFIFRNSVGTDNPPSNAPRIHGKPLPVGYGLIPADVMEYFVWEYGIVKPIP